MDSVFGFSKERPPRKGRRRVAQRPCHRKQPSLSWVFTVGTGPAVLNLRAVGSKGTGPAWGSRGGVPVVEKPSGLVRGCVGLRERG